MFKNFADKFNLIIFLAFCLVCLVGNICFYLLIYSLKRKKTKYFIEDKYDEDMSYFTEAYEKFVRNFVIGFIQGLFLDQYFVLLCSLSCLKFSVCGVVLFTK